LVLAPLTFHDRSELYLRWQENGIAHRGENVDPTPHFKAKIITTTPGLGCESSQRCQRYKTRRERKVDKAEVLHPLAFWIREAFNANFGDYTDSSA